MFGKGNTIKQRYHVTFVSASNVVPNSSDELFLVAWKRGAKKENKGHTAAAASKGGVVEWNETITMMCTLVKQGVMYDAKNISFTIKEEKGKKRRTLGKTTLDLSEYADLAGSSVVKTLAIRRKGTKSSMTLTVRFSSENMGQATGDEPTEILQDDHESDDEEIDFAHYEDTHDAKTNADVPPSASTPPTVDSHTTTTTTTTSSTSTPSHGRAGTIFTPVVVASDAPSSPKDHSRKHHSKEKNTPEQPDVVVKERDKAVQSLLALRHIQESANAKRPDEAQLACIKMKDELDRIFKEGFMKKRKPGEIVAAPPEPVSEESGSLDIKMKAEVSRLTLELQVVSNEAMVLRQQLAKLKREQLVSGTAEASTIATVSDTEQEHLRTENAQLKTQLARMKELDEKVAEDDEIIQILHQERNELRQKLKAAASVGTQDSSQSGAKLREVVRLAEQGEEDAKNESATLRKNLQQAQHDAMEKEVSHNQKMAAQLAVEADLRKQLALLKGEGYFPHKSAKSAKADSDDDEDGSIALQHRVDSLSHELDICDLVIKVFYQVDTPQVGGANKPRACTALLNHMCDWDCFETPDEALFNSVVTALRSVSLVHTGNYQMMCYWLSTSWNVVQGVHQHLSDMPNFSQLTETERTYIVKVSGGEPEDALQRFIFHLRQVMFDQYMSLIKTVQMALQPILVSAILQQGTAILHKNPVLTADLTPPHRRKALRAIEGVLCILVDLEKGASNTHLPASLCFQIFSQIVHWINATIFNQLLSKPELCTCSNGFQIRLALSELEEFFKRYSTISRAAAFLEHVRQAATLLVLDKSILLDPKHSATVFGVLNSAQIFRLVQFFKPDSLSPSPVPEAVLDRVGKTDSAAMKFELDPNEFIIPRMDS
ncbi:DIL domain [Pelomyxa schiedti]|nr:DIL domain [Pelomyxa schiedti]